MAVKANKNECISEKRNTSHEPVDSAMPDRHSYDNEYVSK